MNPIIKFTTLFGLLAVELAQGLERQTSAILAVVFGVATMFFVWRSFYGMRINTSSESVSASAPAAEASST
jgi:K(+)-stimulated pyrophosphate-energized sodium pump